MPRQSTKITRTCLYCGGSFLAHPCKVECGQAKYCSRACTNAASCGPRPERSRKIERQCQNCNASFLAYPSAVARNGAIYCSKACQQAGMNNRVELICVECGVTFFRGRSKVSEYCSLSCSLKHRKRQPDNCTCGVCGKRFYRKPSRITQGASKHCSIKCRAIAKRRASSNGRTNWQYREWRKSVFVRDDYTCQRCNQRGGSLHAHHIKSWALFPELRYDVANGETLCEACHVAAHPHVNFNR